MGKVAFVIFLLSCFNPNADFDVKGNVIYMDKQDGSPVIAVKIDEVSEDPVRIELNGASQ